MTAEVFLFSFGPIEASSRQRPALRASVVLHLALLAWLLHSPRPIFVAPKSVLGGVGGANVTHLYWPVSDGSGDNLPTTDHDAKAKSASHRKLQLPKHEPTLASAVHDSAPSLPAPEENDSANASPGRSAGSAYGSLSEGPDAGHDIRPALPASTFEPIVNTSELGGVPEGNCIVEITIDESGTVVAQSVVQSMGPVIDEAVLQAVVHWHFRPATRDGVPIPSKQDVVYHFKPRN
jgi:protein TonB